MTQVWNQVFVEWAGSVPPVLASLLLVAGTVILLLGWRFSRLVAIADFAVFGAVCGAVLAPGEEYEWLAGGIGAFLLAILALQMDQYMEMIASGLIAALAAAMMMAWLAVPLVAMVLGIAAAFVCAVGFSAVVVRESVAVTTAIQGGLLAAFGLTSCLACHDTIWWSVRGILENSGAAMILFLLAPIGVGVSFQLAAIQTEEGVAHGA